MVPLVKGFVTKLLNEPVMALSLLSGAAIILDDNVPLPAWVKAGGILVFGLATRSVTKGPLSE